MRYVGLLKLFSQSFLLAITLVGVTACKMPFLTPEDLVIPSADSLSDSPYLTVNLQDPVMVKNACHAVVVSHRDTSGNITGVSEKTKINLSTDGSALFYRNSLCTQRIRSLTLNAGSSQATFYVKDTVQESFELVAETGESIIASAREDMSAEPYGAVDNSATTNTLPATTVANGSTSASFTVTFKDSYGNAVPFITPIVSVSGSGNSVPSCGASNSSGGATCTFNSTKAETKTITLISPDAVSLGTVSFVAGPADGIFFTTTPTATTAGATVTAAFVLKDAQGNILTNDNTTTITLSGLGVGGTKTGTVSAGVLTLNAFTMDSAGSVVLTATTSGGKTVSTTVVVSPGAVDTIAFTTTPTAATSGANVTAAFALKDAQGNTVTTDNTTTISLSGSGVSGTKFGTVNSGLLTLNAFTMDTTGNIVLTATTSGGKTVSTTVVVSPGAVDTIAFTTTPTAATSGANVTAAFALKDAQGNTVTTDNTTTITLSGIGVGGTKTGTVAAGVLTLNAFTMDSAGSVVLTATTSGSKTVSTTVVVSPGAVDTIAFTTTPTAATSGANVTAAFVLKDAQGNTVTTDNTTTITLSGSGVSGTKFGTVNSGLLTLNAFTMDTPGNIVLTATTSGGKTVSTTVVVSPGAVDTIAFTTTPTAATSGANVTAAFVLKDAQGNTVTTDNTTTITLSGSGVSGTKFGTVNSGLLTLNAFTMDTPGNIVLTATTSGGKTVSTTVVVSPGAVDTIAFTTTPTAAVAGTNVTAAFVLKDAQGNTVTTDNTTTITLSGLGVGGTKFGTVNSGVLTLNAFTMDTTGNIVLTATTSGGKTVSTTVVVSPGAVDSIIFTTAPGTANAGSSVTAAFALRDAQGNTVTTDNTTTITLSGSGVNGSRTGTVVAGELTLNAFTMDSAGSHSLIATTSGGKTVNTTVVVSPGNPDRVVFITPPSSPVTAGDTLLTTVALQDAFGNTITTDNLSSVTLNATGISGITSAVVLAGQITMSSFSLNTPGTYTFTASSGSLTDATTSVTVNAAAPAQLAFTAGPWMATAGDTLTVTVEVQDGNGVAMSADSSTVITLSAPGINGTRTGTVTNGSLTLNNFRLETAGAITLSADATGLATATTTVNVSAGPVTQFAVTAPSPSTTAGTCETITVEGKDAYGNTNASSTEGFSVTSNNIALYTTLACGGTATDGFPSTLAGGTATFYYKAGAINNASENLVVTNGGALTGGASFNVWGGTAAAISLGVAVTPSVDECQEIAAVLKDASGNNTTYSSGPVLVTFTNTAGGSPAFYSDSLCASAMAVRQNTIVAGTQSTKVYFKNTLAGATNTVTGSITVPAASSANKSITWQPGDLHHLAISGASPVDVNTCNDYVVTLQDQYDNPVPSVGNTNLTFSQTVGTTDCTTTLSTTQSIASGSSSTTVKFMPATIGTHILSATKQSTSFTGSKTITSQAGTIVAGTTAAFAMDDSSQNIVRNVCTPITIESEDSGGAAVEQTVALTVTLSSTAGTIYSDYQCSVGFEASTVSIPSQSSKGTFYILVTSADPTVTISASGAGATSSGTYDVIASINAYRFQLAGTTSMTSNACTEFTVAMKTSAGSDVEATGQYQVTTTAKSNYLLPATSLIYSDDECSTTLAGGVVSFFGTTSSKFYFKSDKAVYLDLLVSDPFGITLASSVTVNVNGGAFDSTFDQGDGFPNGQTITALTGSPALKKAALIPADGTTARTASTYRKFVSGIGTLSSLYVERMGTGGWSREYTLGDPSLSYEPTAILHTNAIYPELVVVGRMQDGFYEGFFVTKFLTSNGDPFDGGDGILYQGNNSFSYREEIANAAFYDPNSFEVLVAGKRFTGTAWESAIWRVTSAGAGTLISEAPNYGSGTQEAEFFAIASTSTHIYAGGETDDGTAHLAVINKTNNTFTNVIPNPLRAYLDTDCAWGSRITSLAHQSAQGYILVAGECTLSTGSKSFVFRVNTLDNTVVAGTDPMALRTFDSSTYPVVFVSAGLTYESPTHVLDGGDGKILIGGDGNLATTPSVFAISLKPDGYYDDYFNRIGGGSQMGLQYTDFSGDAGNYAYSIGMGLLDTGHIWLGVQTGGDNLGEAFITP